MNNILSISGLRKSYHQGETRIEVLNDLSLDVRTEERLSIIGRSGSGKSTLLSLLAGLDTADSGSLLFEGSELSALTSGGRTALRGEKMGVVFQQFHLIRSLTALENIALPLQILGRSVKESEDTARQWCARVGLSHRTDHLPSQLSGGESQRVALARAMVHAPRLLLADEPSGNLDDRTGDEIMNLLFEVCAEKKMTLILVTHSLELASRCESVYELAQGRLHLKGAP